MESLLNNECLSSYTKNTQSETQSEDKNVQSEDTQSVPQYEHPNFTICTNFMFFRPSSVQLRMNYINHVGIRNG